MEFNFNINTYTKLPIEKVKEDMAERHIIKLYTQRVT